jgi:isopentenyldiphosphate isomerase
MTARKKAEPAQDPAELFDIVTAEGVPTGRTKTRAEVHRDGDWHQSIHVWIAGENDARIPSLLFQRRSTEKDTWGGYLDATVGGHFRAGESLAETLRETEEEIGIEVNPDRLKPLGVRICANEAEGGILDREVQQLFLYESNEPLTSYRPHPAELAGLIRAEIDDLLRLFAEEIDSITVEWLATGSDAVEHIGITRADFIPNIDRYFYRVALAAAAVLRGERYYAV